MSTAALVTMLLAWGVIGTFTIRFFVKVLRNPMKEEEK